MPDPLTPGELEARYAELAEIGIAHQYHLESIGREATTDFSFRCPACGSTITGFGTVWSEWRPYPPDSTTDNGNSWKCCRCGTIFDPDYDCRE